MNTVMGNTKDKTLIGQLSYCSSSSYKGLPLNSQYVVLTGDAQQQIDFDILKQQVAEIQSDLKTIHSFMSTAYGPEIASIEARLHNYENRITSLETSIGEGSGSIDLLYKELSSTDTVRNITLSHSWKDYDLLLFEGAQSGTTLMALYNKEDSLISATPSILLGESEGAMTYTFINENTLTSSDVNGAVYIKRIYGIKIG